MRSRILAALVVQAPLVASAQPADVDRAKISVGGYLEAFYQLHVQDPSNHVTNLRGFDNRSRTFTLSNVALDVNGERGPVAARVVLQVGHTPSTSYLAEPASPGSSSANASDGALWKYLQAATLTAKAPRDVVIEAGLMPSPIGIEVIPIKDNWNWSRSNLFFGLPAYHVGAVVSRPLADGWTGKLHVYNGWNAVVDNNGAPSVALSAAYAGAATVAQVLYFGGVERATGAVEGAPWRHLIDVLVQHAVTDRLALAAQVDAGVEPNDLGTSAWLAGALYVKYAIDDTLHVAGRGDYFRERVPDGAAAIFWPTAWVASGTATLAYQPAAGISVRLEYRHDHAGADAFFGGDVATDPVTMQPVPDRETQDTTTLGVTAWF